MQFTDFSALNLARLPSPCFVVDEVALERNLTILNNVQARSGAKVLHALKAFSMWSLAPLTNKYLTGTCSSGLHEAKLAHEFYQGEIHVYSAAFSEADLRELVTFAHHIVFNSPSQILRFENICREALKNRTDLSFGLRINPQHSEGDVPLYDPCAKGSRLGTPLLELEKYLITNEFSDAFSLISGIHFHNLCEHGFSALERTLASVEKQFSFLFEKLKWINFGGGHHITATNYDIDGLINCLIKFQEKHPLQVYLEPGEAIAIGTGILSCEVLDVIHNDIPQLILDTSATCHMPDTIEMPYRPDIHTAGQANEKAFTYRLGGLTCLAGDIINDYSFDEEVAIGQRLYFEDMSHYTMVKTSTFNGTKLPAIAIWNSTTDELNIVKNFGYEDFKQRLS